MWFETEINDDNFDDAFECICKEFNLYACLPDQNDDGSLDGFPRLVNSIERHEVSAVKSENFPVTYCVNQSVKHRPSDTPYGSANITTLMAFPVKNGFILHKDFEAIF